VLCSGTVRRAGFPETVEVAAAAGFRGVSVYQHEYAAARRHGWTDDRLRRHLADHAIAVSEVDGAMAWLPGDGPGDAPAPRVRLAAVDDGRAAALVGALRAQGCAAPLEVEVTSDAMDTLPPAEAARRAMAALRGVLPASGSDR
jgi:sugar phosphate isomerase/epimerase